MSTTSIVPVSVASAAATPLTVDVGAGAQSANMKPDGVFNNLLTQLENVNTKLVNADQAVQQLASGQTDNLHQVMISLEQARLSFDLLLQVRNKVLDAYQEIMRMQV